MVQGSFTLITTILGKGNNINTYINFDEIVNGMELSVDQLRQEMKNYFGASISANCMRGYHTRNEIKNAIFTIIKKNKMKIINEEIITWEKIE
jgi:hypothetical protein